MMNEQPFVDVTLMGLVHVTEHDVTTAYKQDDLGTTSKTSSSAPAFTSATVEFKSDTDRLIGQVEEFRARMDEMEKTYKQDKQKKPVIELDVSLVSSFPPPTWSMLQEAEMIKSCSPVMVRKQTSKTRQDTLDAIDYVTSLSRQTTTPDTFKPRPTLSTDKYGKPFELSKASGKEPSSVGMDDTMKSPSEVRLEVDNRRMWEKRSMLTYIGNKSTDQSGTSTSTSSTSPPKAKPSDPKTPGKAGPSSSSSKHKK